MLTQDVAIETVRNYARSIEARGIDLRSVFLYGSFAKGTQNEWSDIDVALVADEFTGFYFDDAKLLPYLGSREPYVRIEAKTYPTNYFQQGDPFINEIIKTGIKVI